MSGTREAIESAARRQFSELGFDRTSMRQVAREAEVDPALVTHYFGSKVRLFSAVAELPFDPAVVVPRVVGTDPGTAGERLADLVVVQVLNDAQARERIVGIVRAAASEPAAAAIVRERVTREILLPIASAIGGDQPEYRASLLMSQVIGVVMVRHVVGVEPLASAPAAQVAADLAPTLQRYLTGPLAAAPSDA